LSELAPFVAAEERTEEERQRLGHLLKVLTHLRPGLIHCDDLPGFPRNVDDRTPVPALVKRLRGKLFGDRGYISAPLTSLLFEQGLQLVTRLRKNRKNHLMHLSDKLLIRKRAIIESLIDQLKNISETRAFSPSQSRQLCRAFDRRAHCRKHIRTKSQVCISINTLCWLLDQPRLNRTHVIYFA
jgi:Transposase DDE domain